MGGAYLRSRIKQAGKWDQETIVSFFLCQYCSGEYLQAHDLHDANRIIQELWNKLREYEDRLALSSRNSSKSPSSDSPAAKAERKKLRRLVAEIRLALNLDTRGIDEN